MARRRFASVRGARRKTDWSASVAQTALLAVAGSAAALLQVFVPFAGGETIIRIRGLLTVRSDQNAASENMIGAFGICVVTEQAVSVGITAIPHSATDASWDGWLLHQFIAERFLFFSSVGAQTGDSGLGRYPLDSKAMRKINDDERMVLVYENSSSLGTNLTDSIRVLTKLH